MGPSIERRTALALALGLAPGLAALVESTGLAQPTAGGRVRNVLDYGAKADGVTDDTAAFNRATSADAAWAPSLASAIRVPAGRYRVAGSVFVRRGQSLIGDGLSTIIDATNASGSTFILGRRRGGDRGQPDPEGPPVFASSLMGLGGNPQRGFVYVATQGFQLRDLFLSAVGMGIEIEGADGIISNISVDQCLVGFYFRRSQNILVNQANIFLPNYGVIVGSQCHDITVSNALTAYARFAAVLLPEDARDIANVALRGCNFTSNEPYPTFLAHVYSRASGGELRLEGCTFRNVPGYAIRQDHGTRFAFDLQNCLFDGSRTNPAYNQSRAAKGILTGHGRFTLTGCRFRNLAGPAITVGPGLESLDLQGGSIDAVADPVVSVIAGDAGSIRMKDLEGIVESLATGDNQEVSVPDLGPRTIWQVSALSADQGPREDRWVVGRAAARQVEAADESAVRVVPARLQAGRIRFILPRRGRVRSAFRASGTG